MTSLAEQPAVLSVHQTSPGAYIVRVSDLRYRPLVVAVRNALPDLASLVVVTPTDIKVFAGTGEVAGPPPVVNFPAEPEGPELSDEALQAAIAEQEGHALPNAEPAEPVLPAGQEVVGETAQGTKVVRRRKSNTPSAGHDETCQRCRGGGKVQMLMDGGNAAETTCPICKGEGMIRRYGAKR